MRSVSNNILVSSYAGDKLRLTDCDVIGIRYDSCSNSIQFMSIEISNLSLGRWRSFVTPWANNCQIESQGLMSSDLSDQCITLVTLT